MRIIVFGALGLLGNYLRRELKGEELFAWDKEDLDITDRDAVMEQCLAAAPDVIINTAAYNAVDEAEQRPEASRAAFLVNAHAVQRLAEAALEANATFIHFSTDYVFDGQKGVPYSEDDEPHPLSAYGRSKREGEELILRMSERGLKYYLIRTSRLFGARTGGVGKETFPDLVLRLAAERQSLSFIHGSEVASPTFAGDLARSVVALLRERPESGIYHRTNDGAASWYEFAETVLDFSGTFTTKEGVTDRTFIELMPVAAADVPRPAPRPAYSVLATTKLPPLRSWRDALAEYLQERERAMITQL